MNEKPRFYIETLGCRVNQYESRAMAEEFLSRGYLRADDAADASVIVVNTCAVTAESERKSRQAIRRAADTGAKVIVAGCCPVTPDKLPPNVVCIGSARRKSGIADIAAGAEIKPAPEGYESLKIGFFPDDTRSRAWIKIQDGCPNHCSYCIIPLLRGPSRCRDSGDILDEVQRIARTGIKEVVLTGIEISANKELPRLIRRISEVNGIERIRLGSLDPRALKNDLLDAFSQSEKFMPRLHISLQSGSTRILSLMKRGYTAEQASERIGETLVRLPRLLLSADVITSFPGETDGELDETMTFLERFPFVHVHAFPFSPRRGTEAALMRETLSQAEKKQRNNRLISRCRVLRDRILDSLCGTFDELLVESCREGHSRGMTRAGVETEVPGCAEVSELVRVRINAADDGLLLAERV